jgi:hypothetical protein
MALFRLRGNNYWLWTVCWSGTALALMTWQLCRRTGVSTDYARVKFLCTSGEYRTLVECGAVPENRFLPPHLRLDQKSYLDAEDAVVTEPPAYDLSVTEKELIVALVDVLPEDRKIDLSMTWFGVVNTRSMAIPIDDHDRVLKRRLGVSTQPDAISDLGVEGMAEEAGGAPPQPGRRATHPDKDGGVRFY